MTIVKDKYHGLYNYFTGYSIIHQYSAAILTDNDLFPRFNIELSLGWNLIETPAAGVALNGYYSESVPRIQANPLIGS